MKKSLTLTIVLLFFIGCTINIDDANLTYSGDTADSKTTGTGSTSLVTAISDLSATSNDGIILFNWTEDLSANSYNAYCSNTKNVHDTVVENIPYPYVRNVANGTSIYCVITAVNSMGENAYSNEASATAGIVDNMNGTISDLLAGRTWSKCQQTSVNGGNAYSSFNNDCMGGTPMKLQICDTDNMCGDGYTINTETMIANGSFSEAFNSCASMILAGSGGWRLPTMNELEELSPVYQASSSLWSGFVEDYLWSMTDYMGQPQNGYAQAAYDIHMDNFQPFIPMVDFPYYVLCVK